MEVIPMSIAEANAFVTEHHRHHGPTVSHKFSIGVAVDGLVVGVAIVGRPVARHFDDTWTLEVYRVCTDGTPNAASKLYGACRRAAWALGYRRLITYTLATEPGSSLRAAGWKVIGERPIETWNRPNAGRPRVDRHPTQTKLLWEASA